MKKLLMSIFVCLSLLFIIFYVESGSVSIKQETKNNGRYVPNEVLVKFKPNVNKDTIRAAISSIQGQIFTYLRDEISTSAWEPDEVSLRSFRLDPCLLHIKVPESIGTEKAIELLSKDPNIEFAEKNSIGYLSETEPKNDERFDEQWALRNNYGSDIDATYAWDISTGNSNIIVAVIDTGVDYDHDDLEGNMWINEDEIPGNGNDDDNNGYIDDVYGYDFKNNDNDPEDNDGHGTHVAGIIGAIANNEIGIVGVNWTVKIMVLKMSNDGSFCTTDAIHAIDYSTANAAHLSNNSWAIGDEYNHTFCDKTATAGVIHYYKVRAFNFAGDSSFSNIKSTTIPATTPATPTGLWARSPSPPDGVQLSWYDSSNNELNFIIERKSFSFPIWEEIGGTMQNISWYFDENLQPGETYWYRVRAWNPIGYSSYSNEIQVVIWDY